MSWAMAGEVVVDVEWVGAVGAVVARESVTTAWKAAAAAEAAACAEIAGWKKLKM